MVVIDIGHCKAADGTPGEYAYCEQLAQAIAATPGHWEISNRSDVGSKTIGGAARAANAKLGDVVVSLHANAYDGKASGTETWYVSPAGLRIAKAVQEAMVDTLGLPDRGCKWAQRSDRAYPMLQRTIAPCVLIEVGFLDNPHDAAVLRDKIYHLAHSISRALSQVQ